MPLWLSAIETNLSKKLHKILCKKLNQVPRNIFCLNFFFIFKLHTYIIGHYNPSVRIIELVSHTTYVVCVNFTHNWQDLQSKVDSKRQISWESFHGNFIYSQSYCQKSAERKSPNEYFSYFVLMSGLRFEPCLFV